MKTVSSVMAASQAVSAIAERIAFFDLVTSLAAPVAHFTIVLAPGMYGAVANGDLSPSSSLALEVGGFVHVAVNMVTDASNGVSSSQCLELLYMASRSVWSDSLRVPIWQAI